MTGQQDTFAAPAGGGLTAYTGAYGGSRSLAGIAGIRLRHLGLRIEPCPDSASAIADPCPNGKGDAAYQGKVQSIGKLLESAWPDISGDLFEAEERQGYLGSFVGYRRGELETCPADEACIELPRKDGASSRWLKLEIRDWSEQMSWLVDAMTEEVINLQDKIKIEIDKSNCIIEHLNDKIKDQIDEKNKERLTSLIHEIEANTREYILFLESLIADLNYNIEYLTIKREYIVFELRRTGKDMPDLPRWLYLARELRTRTPITSGESALSSRNTPGDNAKAEETPSISDAFVILTDLDPSDLSTEPGDDARGARPIRRWPWLFWLERKEWAKKDRQEIKDESIPEPLRLVEITTLYQKNGSNVTSGQRKNVTEGVRRSFWSAGINIRASDPKSSAERRIEGSKRWDERALQAVLDERASGESIDRGLTILFVDQDATSASDERADLRRLTAGDEKGTPRPRRVLGRMFDLDDTPRQGFAIFTETMREVASEEEALPRVNGSSGETPLERIYRRVLVHEIGHALNLPHSWHDLDSFVRVPALERAASWMSYPRFYGTGPITDAGLQEANRKAYLAALGENRIGFTLAERLHLAHAPWPMIAFGQELEPSLAAARRRQRVVEETGFAAPTRAARLAIDLTLPEAVEMGEPVESVMRLRNLTTGAVATHAHLSPAAGMVELRLARVTGTARDPRDLTARKIAPATIDCAEEGLLLDLSPKGDLQGRDRRYQRLRPSLGRGGWVIHEPGRYLLQAFYRSPDDEPIASPIREIVVHPPLVDRRRVEIAAQDLFSAEGALWFTVEGSAAGRLASTHERMQRLVRDLPAARVTQVIRLDTLRYEASPLQAVEGRALWAAERIADAARQVRVGRAQNLLFTAVLTETSQSLLTRDFTDAPRAANVNRALKDAAMDFLRRAGAPGHVRKSFDVDF